MKKISLVLSLFLLLTACGGSALKIETSGMLFEIGTDGMVKSIIDASNDKEYLPEAAGAPLLALRVDSTFYLPKSAKWDEKNNLLSLSYDGDRSAVVKIKQKPDYFTMEVTGVETSSNEHLDLVVWGSYPTTISQIIGETVGVVRDSSFAFGLRALSPKTLGGYPSAESDIDPMYDIFATNSIVDVADSVKVLYRGHTAVFTDNGSKIHAYTRNRDKTRVINMWNHDRYTAPAYEKDGGVIGSSIAIFGSPANKALDYLEKIVIGEKLPYPQIGGEWNKKSPDAAQAYIIYPFNENNIEEAIAFTKRTGLKYLYHGGPFKTWGTFLLNEDEFPSGIEGLKTCVDKAAANGIKLGVHTLSNFTTTNDPYVTPIPDKRLAKVGSSVIVADINAEQTEIEIKSPDFFNQMKNNSLHGVVIGNELIRYERVSDSAPWKLLGCQRGAWGTKASNHKSNAEIAKLMDHGYNVFLTDTDLTKEMARNLSDLFNKTGLEQISFDGLEGAWSTGMGQYGLTLMFKEWYDNLKPELKNNINDASMTTHYNWYMFTRMNWGEPWYAGFRESQMTYRLMNQDYYRRNLIPCMLGWFKYDATTSLEDLEWLMARSAAFDAGYTLVTNAEAVKENGYSDRLIKGIKEWENARLSLAFPQELKAKMENTANEYSLNETSPTTWDLYPYTLMRYKHKNFVRQPGEPSITKWNFNNPNERQAIIMLIKADDNISNITLNIGGYSSINLPISLAKGETLKYEGGNAMAIYDTKWNIKRTVKVDETKLMAPKGEFSIAFGCDFATKDSEKSVSAEIKTKGAALKLTAKRERP